MALDLALCGFLAGLLLCAGLLVWLAFRRID